MKRPWACCALLGLLVAVSPLSASTFVAVSGTELVEQADSVIQGRVLQLNSFWDEPGRLIVTEATIQVFETIVGEAESVLTVRVPGGTVDGFGVLAAGFPSFEPGEQVVLFVGRQSGEEFHRVVGHQQGHFEVVERRDGVTLAVPRIEEGARFFTRSGQLMAEPRSLPLAELKTRIQGLADEIDRRIER